PGHHFTPYAAGGPADAELLGRAAARAAELGLTQGDRVLLDVTAHPDPVDWLLAPLVAGASTVLCANADPARLPARAETERVTRTLA
ncbi:TIGR03089 family protein, partial [Micromonospora sp. DH15]|nr:TIGR03089 family protein [Micromonospora sp. DH15]